MSAPGYLCYYARHVKVYQYDPRVAWDLRPWWDALSPSVKKLYQDEEEGRMYIDPNDHLITAVGLYYYHHRRTARMANSARAWDTLRKQWENESADVRGYWEGLLFYRRASIASPAVSSNSVGAAAAPAQIIPTAVTSYYPQAPSQVPQAKAQAPPKLPKAPRAREVVSHEQLQALIALFDAHGDELREMITGSKSTPCTDGEIEALVAFFAAHGDEFKIMVKEAL